MATFTALVKTYSTEYFCNAKVAGLGETLSSEIFGYNILWYVFNLFLAVAKSCMHDIMTISYCLGVAHLREGGITGPISGMKLQSHLPYYF